MPDAPVAPGPSGADHAQPERSEPHSGPRAIMIVNPRAGFGDRAAGGQSIVGAFVEQGWQVDVRETAAAGDATRLAAAAAAEGLTAVLVAGGDGTINEVVQALAGTSTALGAVPLGTANVWARELGLSLDPVEAARELAAGTVRRIDLGRANERYFLLMAGLGLDAEAVVAVEGAPKRRFGPFALAWAGLTTAFRTQGAALRVQADGERQRLRAAMVTVGNTRLWAGPFQITDRASVADGQLDACFFRGRGLLGKIRHVALVLVRRHHDDPDVTYVRVRELQISSRPPLPLQVDGEPHGTTPVRITVVPRALRVLIGSSTAPVLDGAPVEPLVLGGE